MLGTDKGLKPSDDIGMLAEEILEHERQFIPKKYSFNIYSLSFFPFAITNFKSKMQLFNNRFQ